MIGNDQSLSSVFGIKTHFEEGIKHKERERQRATYTPTTFRKNNRKNTRSRRTQYIKWVDTSVFPPKLRTRCIKHDSR